MVEGRLLDEAGFEAGFEAVLQVVVMIDRLHKSLDLVLTQLTAETETMRCAYINGFLFGAGVL